MSILIERFWNHVVRTPDSTAIFLNDVVDYKARLLEVTWEQSGVAVAAFMCYLRRKGVKHGDRVAILGWQSRSENNVQKDSPEWLWADLAIQSLGAVTVPIYPNSSRDQINFILGDAGVQFVFVADPKYLQYWAAEDKEGKIVKVGEPICFEEMDKHLGLPVPFQTWIVPAYNPGIFVQATAARAELEQMKRAVAENSADSFAGITQADLATIIYTSGSSGNPKGCMISHGNIQACLEGLAAVVKLDPEKDLYLSYLPMAHVYERLNGTYVCIWNKVPMGFSPIDRMAANLSLYKPTMLCGVPAGWEKMRNGLYEPKALVNAIQALHLPKGTIKLWKGFLNFAVRQKPSSLLGKFLDRTLFARVRAKMGGRLRLLISGSAPISKEVLDYFDRLGYVEGRPDISLETLEGYGATETCGGIITNRPGNKKVGTVGLPIPGCKMRVVKAEGEEELEGGEIQLSGPQIFVGYWKNQEATRDAFSDGFYKTGDLVTVDADGFVSIKGRMNGMYKTAQGKYVSTVKVENAFKEFSLIHYLLPVAYKRKYATALVFVNQEKAKALVGPAPDGVEPAQYYASHQAVLTAVAQAIAEGNKQLEHWERVSDFKVMPMAATVDGGIITETQKLRNKVLLKRFEKEIDELYENPTRR